MDNCSKHRKDILGESDMKVLAEMIGDLHYEALASLFKELGKKLQQDSRNDWKNKKTQLSNRLKIASNCLKGAYVVITEAWQISKPFMENNTEPEK